MVHVAASSSVSGVKLMSTSRLKADRGEGENREGHTDGLSDGGHGERC